MSRFTTQGRTLDWSPVVRGGNRARELDRMPLEKSAEPWSRSWMVAITMVGCVAVLWAALALIGGV